MFTSMRTLTLAAVVLGAGLFAAGCQSNGGGATASGVSPAATQAVTCSKCQVTWTKVPITPGGGKDWKVTGYTTRKSHECPDCRSAVENFFASGNLEHTCKTWGDAMEVCHLK